MSWNAEKNDIKTHTGNQMIPDERGTNSISIQIKHVIGLQYKKKVNKMMATLGMVI